MIFFSEEESSRVDGCKKAVTPRLWIMAGMWEQFLCLYIYHLSIHSYIQTFIHSTSIIECLLCARDCRNTKGSKRLPLILGRGHLLGIFLKCNMWKMPYLGLGRVLMVKNPLANAWEVRYMGLTPGSGRSPRGGHGNLLLYSCLENPVDRGAWWATVRQVTQSWTRLSNLAHTQRREEETD